MSVQNNSSLRTRPDQQIAPSAGSPSDDEASTICCDPAHVKNIWPHAKGFIAKAFEIGIGDATFEATEFDVLSGIQLLWIVWYRGAIAAAVTTSLVETPRFKLCVITACGGSEMVHWLKLIKMVEAYASAEGCDRVRVMGRVGWRKMLADYREPWIVLDKSLKD